MFEIVLPFSVNITNVLKFIVLELVLLPLVSWAANRVNSKTNWNGILKGHLRVRKALWIFPVSRLNVRLGFVVPLVALGLSLAAEFGFGSRGSETVVKLRGLRKRVPRSQFANQVVEIEAIISACFPERATPGFESSRPLVVNSSTGTCVAVNGPSVAAVDFRNVWQGQTEANISDKLHSINLGKLPRAGPTVLRGKPRITNRDDQKEILNDGKEYIFSGFKSEDLRFERGGLCRAVTSSTSESSDDPSEAEITSSEGWYKVKECMVWGLGGLRISRYQVAGTSKCPQEESLASYCAGWIDSLIEEDLTEDEIDLGYACCSQSLFTAFRGEVVLSSIGENQLWVDVNVTNAEATFEVLAHRDSPTFVNRTEWQGRIAALVVALNELEVVELEVSVTDGGERATVNVLGIVAMGAILSTAIMLLVARLVLGCFIEGSLDLGVTDVLDRWFDEVAELGKCANPAKSDRTLKLIRTGHNVMHISITGIPTPHDGVSKIQGTEEDKTYRIGEPLSSGVSSTSCTNHRAAERRRDSEAQ